MGREVINWGSYKESIYTRGLTTYRLKYGIKRYYNLALEAILTGDTVTAGTYGIWIGRYGLAILSRQDMIGWRI
jgi:hypothetical protein